MKSIWEKGITAPAFPALRGDAKVDTLIIGGGISGILTAYMLKKRGISCVIVEAGRILTGTTRGTTAKVTAQHGLIFKKLIKSFGEDAARQYLYENLRAVEMYRDIISRENIDCDFRDINSALYSIESADKLSEERAALKSLGYDAELISETELPFKVAGALKFKNQATINPLKLAYALAKKLEIYENTQVFSLSEGSAKTAYGEISARRIVLTSHFPFVNVPGYYFLRMHKERSYVLALNGIKELSGAYLGIDSGNLSFRSVGNVLLLGGGGHRCGEFTKDSGYTPLKKSADELYPNARELLRWSTEDCMTHDGVPYIGKFSKELSSVYVATGFNKWGMTTSLLAADLLSRKLGGEEVDFGIFDPQRKNFAPSLAGLLEDGEKSAAGLLKSAFSVPKLGLSDIKRGDGAVIEHAGEAYGAYVDTDGTAYIVSAKCPHLGCRLSWNPDERTWDCPCHGSRFSFNGEKIGNPAQTGLECRVQKTQE